MLSSQRITQIISLRYSVRNYQEKPIPDEIQLEFKARLAEIRQGPLGSPLRLEMAAATTQDTQQLRGLGTYGTIHNPTGFIVGAVKAGEHAMEDYGFAMERAVLEATALGLGTCWLGGFFTQSGFARRIRKLEDELVPAVAATGYTAEDNRLRDRSRLRVGADERLVWEDLFFEGGFGSPLRRDTLGPYRDALEMVRIGPSAKNKQPWRVIRDGSRWHFYCQRTSGYGKGTILFSLIGAADLQRIDIGIAMCHFELTGRQLGLNGSWNTNDPGLVPVDKNTVYVASWEET